jgi:hypothetical protein
MRHSYNCRLKELTYHLKYIKINVTSWSKDHIYHFVILEGIVYV